MSTIDDVLLIPVLQKGDKLYHYTSAAGLKGICEEEFWITESNFLNDSTEFHVATDIFCEVMDMHMQDREKCECMKKQVCDEIARLKHRGGMHEKVAYCGDYVISFSLDYDSTLMWSEYSDFLGYCMKFDFEKLLHSFPGCNHTIMHGKVIYNHDEQISLIEKAIEHQFLQWPTGFDYLNAWEDFDILTEQEIEDFYWMLAVVIEAYNVFFKLPCFEGEHEYRFVFSCGHDGGRYKPENLEKQYFRIKDEILIPYVRKRLSSLDALEGILIGPKNKSDIAVKGVECFLRNLRLDAKVEKSQMPLRY